MPWPPPPSVKLKNRPPRTDTSRINEPPFPTGVNVASYILAFLLNLGLWAPYIFFLLFSMEPGLLELWFLTINNGKPCRK